MRNERQCGSAVRRCIRGVAAVLLAAAASRAVGQPALRLNQVQAIGTHNSYHAGLAPGEAALLRQESGRTFRALDYRHPPLAQQLDAGVRQIELDVYPDRLGGRYAHPAMEARLAAAGLPPDPPAAPAGAMDRPGFKVMHLAGLDQRSTCATLRDCLLVLRGWSRTHPRHLPVFVLLDCKTPPLDGEVRAVFSGRELLTPQEVRGEAATLREAVMENGWPALDAVRGRVVLLLDNRELAAAYAAGHPQLDGRLLFPSRAPDDPDAVFVDAEGGEVPRVPQLVRAGLLVRVRADADTVQARTNDGALRDRALASSAQLVSTDYPATEPSSWTGYAVSFGTPAGAPLVRCNPVNAPAGCALLER